jgi:hypothetical protein
MYYERYLMKMRFVFLILLCEIANNPWTLYAQTDPEFDISLNVDFNSAERLLDYYERFTNNSLVVVNQKGNQLAAATSVLLARTRRPSDDFQQQLERVRDNIQAETDIYGLIPAKKRVSELRKLITEAKRRQLDRKVIATIKSYFPNQINISASIPVYFVAIGNERAVAVVRRVVWKNDIPQFVGDDEGDPIIIFNLVRVLEISSNIEEQIIGIMSTLAHESFHSVFALLKQSFPDSLKPQSYTDHLLDLVHNEGIAYSLSMSIQSTGRSPSKQWFDATAKAIESFNNIFLELLSPNLTDRRARELMMNANLSGSFESNYGATAGMRMAYEIDSRLGRPVLAATLLQGAHDFFQKYYQACLQDASLPTLDERVLREIGVQEETVK